MIALSPRMFWWNESEVKRIEFSDNSSDKASGFIERERNCVRIGGCNMSNEQCRSLRASKRLVQSAIAQNESGDLGLSTLLVEQGGWDYIGPSLKR